MNENTLEFIVSLRGGDTAASEMARLRSEVSAAGGTIRRVGEQSGVASAGTGKLGGSIKRLAGAFIALGAGYKIYSAAKNAIVYTRELAESSNVLSKATGLNIETSSQYVGVAGALGISSGQLNLAFKSLATQTEKAGKVTHGSTEISAKNRLAKINETAALQALEKRVLKGKLTQSEYNLQLEKLRLSHHGAAAATGTSDTAFAKLGITQQWVAKHGKNFNDVIFEVTKRLNAMPGSTEKTKIETELFGRSWAALNPLLGEGSEHLEHVLGLAKKFGVELHGGVNKELEQLREAQLESTLATDGLRIAFAKTAAGPLINLLHGFARLKNAARLKDWPLFDRELNKVFAVAGHVIETFEVRSIEGFGQLAPKLLGALWRGFQHSSLPNKALMVGIIASKLGLTGAVFGGLGSSLGKALAKKLAIGMAAESAEAAAAGTTLGGLFGGAFLAAALGAGLGYLIAKLFPNGLFGSPTPSTGQATNVIAGGGKGTVIRNGEIKPARGFPHTEANAKGTGYTHSTIGSRHAGGFSGPKESGTFSPGAANRGGGGYEVEDIHGRRYYLAPGEHLPAGDVPKAALGANVMRGGLMQVGERGPEVLDLPAGASVTPLKPGSLADDRPMYLTVDGKVLARVLRRQAILSQAAGA